MEYEEECYFLLVIKVCGCFVFLAFECIIVSNITGSEGVTGTTDLDALGCGNSTKTATTAVAADCCHTWHNSTLRCPVHHSCPAHRAFLGTADHGYSPQRAKEGFYTAEGAANPSEPRVITHQHFHL